MTVRLSAVTRPSRICTAGRLVEAGGPGHPLAQRHAGVVDADAGAGRAELAAGARRGRQVGVADLATTCSSGTPMVSAAICARMV